MNSSLRNPLNSESVELSTTRSEIPDRTTASSRPTVTTQVRTAPPRRTNEWSPIRSQPNSSTRTCASARRGARLQEPPTESKRVVLDRRDPVQLRVGEGGVLLGVRRQHRRLVTGDVRVLEVAAQRRRHVEVPDLVPRGVAHDAHHPALGLAVLVDAELVGHQVLLGRLKVSEKSWSVPRPTPASTSASSTAPLWTPRRRYDASARAVAGSSAMPWLACWV